MCGPEVYSGRILAGKLRAGQARPLRGGNDYTAP